MSVRSVATDQWQRRSLVGLVCLVLLAPVFAWAARQIGYAEPMDNAIEIAGASAEVVPTGISLLSEYGLPGLGAYSGTLAAAMVGTAVTLGLALGLGQLLATGA